MDYTISSLPINNLEIYTESIEPVSLQVMAETLGSSQYG
jgi:hypothetical protein